MKIEDWKKQGNFIEVNNHQVFYVDTGGDKDVLLMLHGYPSSSHDYYKVMPELSKKFRVIIHDHLGFGFSDKPKDYSYSLIEQADIAMQLWMKLGVSSAHLFAHDYGTSVATEINTRRNLGYEPIQLKSLTLCNGSVHIELANLRLIQKLLRHNTWGPIVTKLMSYPLFKKSLYKLWYDKSKLSEEEVSAMWQLLILHDGKTVLPKITQYLKERRRFWNRWVGGLQKTELKTNILWGRNDPVTNEKVARVHYEELKNGELKLLDNTGHYPMLENPDYWRESLEALLK